MRKMLTIVTLAATLLLGACEEEKSDFLLETSLWEMAYEPVGYERTTLVFNGNKVAVMDSNPFTWPLEDDVWEYLITDGGKKMKVKRRVTAYDASTGGTTTSTNSYTFDLTLRYDNTEMELVYDPWLGSRHTMTFYRKQK